MDKFKEFAAMESKASRVYTEQTHELRSEFDRDRDRILYSKAFRRLSGKTQVFLAGNDDHIRTRLTHTLEVAQISNTISKNLGLDETLTEAIALGHDIGHTPFGHVGERTLNYIMNGCCLIKNFNKKLEQKDLGFKHNWQGLRVVSELEQLNRDHLGLNLTDYTMWGILNHSKLKYKACEKKGKNKICNLLLEECECDDEAGEGTVVDFYHSYKETVLKENSWTMEGLVVAIADEIAQRHHDLEDGIEAKIIDKVELVKVFKEYFQEFFNKYENTLIDEIEEEDDENILSTKDFKANCKFSYN